MLHGALYQNNYEAVCKFENYAVLYTIYVYYMDALSGVLVKEEVPRLPRLLK